MTKKINITSRGMVLTSKGKCRTPLSHPIIENVDIIFQMISTYRATVVEILDDGREVLLTVSNYDKDNTVEHESVLTSIEGINAKTVLVSPSKKNKKANEPKTEPAPAKVEPVAEPVKEEVAKVEEPAVVEEAKTEPVAEPVNQETEPANNNRISRKERRKMEYKRQQEAETAATVENTDTTIPEDAIEE